MEKELTRVNVLIEEQRDIDSEERDRKTLGANVVRQDLHTVADQKTRPGEIIGEVVDVDHGDDAVCGRLGSRNGISCRADGPDDESDEHSRGRDEEQAAAADLVDEETHGQRDCEVEDLQHAVDEILRYRVGVAYVVEDFGDIITDKSVTGPLAEKTGSQKDEETVAVAFGSDEFEPAGFVEFFLEAEGVADFDEFELDDFVLWVAVCVNIGEDFQGLFFLVVGDQPAR